MAPVAVILGLSMLVVGLHVRAYPKLSPIDELQHIDYLYRVRGGDIVRMGDRVGQDALREEACRGLDSPFPVPPCRPGVTYRSAEFQELGVNTADIHPPTYYAVTSVVARIFQLFGAESLVTAGRLAGGIWLGAGLALLWLLGEALGIRRLPLAIVLVLVASTPTVVHASATVNPDAGALLSGAGLLAAAVWFERTKRRAWPIALVAAVAVLLKTTVVLAVGASALYLVIRAWRGAGGLRGAWRDERRLLVGAAALVAGGILALVGWVVVHQALAYVSTNPQIERFRVPGLTGNDVAGQLLALFTPVTNPYLPGFLASNMVLAIVQLFGLALAGAGVGAFLYAQAPDRRETVALAATAVLLVGGVAFTLANFFLNSGIFVAIPPRYGLSVLPMLALGLAQALRSRVSIAVTGALAIASVWVLGYGLLVLA